jgi:hypothetical protein
MAIDWVTASSLATAGGTLVLAVATFSSVRSANRAARTAERGLQVGLRPVLFPSRLEDPTQKIRWGDDHWAELRGAGGTFEEVAGNIYLAISLRNVGSGIAVLHSWQAQPLAGAATTEHAPVEEFRPQLRDLYVPSGDISFWQAAIRDPNDPKRPAVLAALQDRKNLFVDLLYSDHEGGQRTISRFILNPVGSDQNQPGWLCSVVRHWNLDRADPRR